jgi:hypothetical protein
MMNMARMTDKGYSHTGNGQRNKAVMLGIPRFPTFSLQNAESKLSHCILTRAICSKCSQMRDWMRSSLSTLGTCQSLQSSMERLLL